MNEIVLVERLILESVSKKEKTINEIVSDTGLDNKLVERIVMRLLKEEVLFYINHKVKINFELFRALSRNKKLLNNINNAEIKEFMDTFISSYFNKREEVRINEDSAILKRCGTLSYPKRSAGYCRPLAISLSTC